MAALWHWHYGIGSIALAVWHWQHGGSISSHGGVYWASIIEAPESGKPMFPSVVLRGCEPKVAKQRVVMACWGDQSASLHGSKGQIQTFVTIAIAFASTNPEAGNLRRVG